MKSVRFIALAVITALGTSTNAQDVKSVPDIPKEVVRGLGDLPAARDRLNLTVTFEKDIVSLNKSLKDPNVITGEIAVTIVVKNTLANSFTFQPALLDVGLLNEEGEEISRRSWTIEKQGKADIVIESGKTKTFKVTLSLNGEGIKGEGKLQVIACYMNAWGCRFASGSVKTVLGKVG